MTDYTIEEIEFFLMAICHQPYSEIDNIPFEKVPKWMKIFQKWIESIFGQGKETKKEKYKRILKVNPPEAWFRHE